MLFYDCHRGDILQEYEKIVKYLTDAYFKPLNPYNVFDSINSNSQNSDSTSNKPSDESRNPPEMNDSSSNGRNRLENGRTESISMVGNFRRLSANVLDDSSKNISHGDDTSKETNKEEEEEEEEIRVRDSSFEREVTDDFSKSVTKSFRVGKKMETDDMTYARLEMEFKNILNKQMEDRHKLYSDYNKEKSKSVLNTLELIKKKILETNDLAKSQYDRTIDNLRSNLLYNVQCVDHGSFTTPTTTATPPTSRTKTNVTTNTTTPSTRTTSVRTTHHQGKKSVKRKYTEFVDGFVFDEDEYDREDKYGDDREDGDEHIDDHCDEYDYENSDHSVQVVKECVENAVNGKGDMELEDLTHFYNLEKFKFRVLLEMKALEFVNSCESSYIYLKYFILATIAKEPNIAIVIERRSDRKKCQNFALYLRFLFKEIENFPFNVRNSTFMIKDVVKAASQYYTNGIVKSNLGKEFYGHEDYKHYK